MGNIKTKVLCITSSYPVHPRLKKIGESFPFLNNGQNDIEVRYLAWDRLNKYKDEDQNCFVYKSNEGYGNKIKKILGLLKFLSFLKKKISIFKPDILICRYVDMALLGWLSKKNAKLIYDVNDLPTYESPFLDLLIRQLEKQIVKHCDLLILSSRFFQDKYDNLNKNMIVLENKPRKKIVKKGVFDFSKKRPIISFIGVVRFYEVMRNLIIALKDKNIDLIFFGSGHDEGRLKNFVKEHNIKNVHFTGAYNFKNIHQFYNISDYIWAAYPAGNIGVKMAISNKFFECLAFKKPGIFSSDTLLAQLIEENNIGYCINPYNIKNISDLIDHLLSENSQRNEIIHNIEQYQVDHTIFWEEMITTLKKNHVSWFVR